MVPILEHSNLVSIISEFTNPYGRRSASRGNSEASSESLSQFGTARDYPDFDLQNDLYWYDEKDEGCFMTPSFEGADCFGCPSEDKFIMTSETEKQFENPMAVYDNSEGLQSETSNDCLDKPCLFHIAPLNNENEVQVTDYYHFDKNDQPDVGIGEKLKNCAGNGCLAPLCKCCGADGKVNDEFSYLISKETDLNDLTLKVVGDSSSDCGLALHPRTKKSSSSDWIEGFKCSSDLHVKGAEKDFMGNEINNYCLGDDEENGELCWPKADADGDDIITPDLLKYDNLGDEYEIFNLRIVHRKNRFVGKKSNHYTYCIKSELYENYRRIIT